MCFFQVFCVVRVVCRVACRRQCHSRNSMRQVAVARQPRRTAGGGGAATTNKRLTHHARPLLSASSPSQLRLCASQLGAMADEQPEQADPAAAAMAELRRKIVEIERDTTLTPAEKALRRQQVMSGGFASKGKEPAPADGAAGGSGDGKGALRRRLRRVARISRWPRLAVAAKAVAAPASALAMIDEALKCAFCFNLCERPVTVRARGALPPKAGSPKLETRTLIWLLVQAPCQHNFCLSCFTKWVQQNKSTCPTCRASIPQSMRQNPRINSALVNAIRMVCSRRSAASAAFTASGCT